MGLLEVWRLGHQVVIDALESAQKGSLRSELFEEFDRISAEFKRQFEQTVPFENRRRFDTRDWTPWLAGQGFFVDRGWQLEESCKRFLPATQLAPDWPMIER